VVVANHRGVLVCVKWVHTISEQAAYSTVWTHTCESVRQWSVDAVARPHGHVLYRHNVCDIACAPVISEPPCDTTGSLVWHALGHHEVFAALALLCRALAIFLSEAVERAE
jgi:hypothetical protein